MDGIVNILKPSGMTSHDVVSYIRKNFNIKKVGHTGTLDPNAVGVLPICLGKGTKLSQYITDKQKKYRCEMTFGKATDTLDSYGEITEIKEIDKIEFEKIKDILGKFYGKIEQIPPAYSAIKVGGVRLYEKVRRGQEIKEIPSRTVVIYGIDVIDYEFPRLMIDITCSSGTYVRSFVRDIAEDLGTVAYMSLLIRLKSGEFDIGNSITLEELSVSELDKNLISISDINLNMENVIIKSTALVSYINGCEVSSKGLLTDIGSYYQQKVRVLDDNNNFIGIGFIKNKNSENFLKSDTLFI